MNNDSIVRLVSDYGIIGLPHFGKWRIGQWPLTFTMWCNFILVCITDLQYIYEIYSQLKISCMICVLKINDTGYTVPSTKPFCVQCIKS